MRKPWPTLAAMSALLLAPLGLHVPLMAQTMPSASSSQAARVIVKLKATAARARALSAGSTLAAPRQAQALSARTGMSLRDGRAIDGRTQVVHARGLSSEQLAARLANDSDVEYAVVDRRQRIAAVPNDPRYAGAQTAITPAVGQWYLRPPAGSVVSAINAENAWNLSTGAGVVVAVLDTGVRFDHPDLAGKLHPGYDFIEDLPTANDGDGMDSDASDPGDWISNGDVAGDFADCDVDNSSWHGTQTAALIGAATNNGAGMAGAGGDVMILPLRVLGKCGGYESDIIAGMRWAVGLSVPGVPANPHLAKVLNLSLGSSASCDPAYADAVADVVAAGAVVVVSAGNDGLAVGAPANCPGAIAVSGVRHTGTKVGYSSLGPEAAISAPAGNCVNETGGCLFPLLTATNVGLTGPTLNSYSNGTNISVGTSFAAPLVAGTAALMFSALPSLTPAQVRTHLQASARAFPTTGAGGGVSACHAPNATPQDSECYCTTSTCGAGLLDASAAVALVAPASSLIPVISYVATDAAPGTAFTLDSARSVVPAGRTVTHEWSVVSGDANITSATNASVATVLGATGGTVVVRLTLTDNLVPPNVATRDVSVVLSAAAPAPAPTSGGGGGGGGALGLAWLGGLALAVIALCERNRRLSRKSISLVQGRSRRD
jgi:serine protease